MSHFSLQCRKCGKVMREVYCAFCEHCVDSLIITKYDSVRLVQASTGGVWRFSWLPVHGAVDGVNPPLIYKSDALASELGLDNLYVAFSGYWPERGADVVTCTFKEYEAATVLLNARENGFEGMVAASAGNTARAFDHYSTLWDFPMLIVVPRVCLQEMWYVDHPKGRAHTIILSDGDYSDAIDLAKRIALVAGMPFEGGVKNIAKRDGLGMVMLEAVTAMGALPDHYVQAVGSGAGAIAAWEMSERFVMDGRFGGSLPRLHLAQNAPFVPMVNAWNRGSREIDPDDLRPELLSQIATRVLSNRYPPYGVTGGVHDAMKACGGAMYGVTNAEAEAGMEMFQRTEGIDIVPAAGVAVAALMQAVRRSNISRADRVLLNITGGGQEAIFEKGMAKAVQGEMVSKKADDDQIEDLLCNTLKLSL